MRKALCALLALAVASSACAVYAAYELQTPAEQIEFEETTLYGDISAADGLRAEKWVQLEGTIVWESTLDFANEGFTAVSKHLYTDNVWNNKRYYDGNEVSDRGVFLNNRVSGGYESTGSGLFAVPPELREVMEELIAETPAGDSREKTIRLADYYTYYPIDAEIRLEDLSYGGYPYDAEEDLQGTPELQAVKAIEEFLRIPVREDEYYTLGVEKEADGTIIRSWGSRAEGSDDFSVNSMSVASEDTCYFCFSDRTGSDKIVDTGRIPGGYGIYSLPYGRIKQENYKGYDYFEGMDVFTERLGLFYEVDPESVILGLTLRADQKLLYLHTAEDGRYFVTAISTETGKAVNRIDIGEYRKDSYYESFSIEGADIILLNESLSVLVPDTASGCRLLYQTTPLPLEREASFEPFHFAGGREIAFDGERIAIIAGISNENMPTDCGFSLAVYDAEGLTYYGRFESSLDKANLVSKPVGGYYPITNIWKGNKVTWHKDPR